MPKTRHKSTCYYVYVLKLQRGKYYVGSSTNPQARLKQHQKGGRFGAAWTNKYKPTKTRRKINPRHKTIQVTRIKTTSKQKCRRAEDRKTRRLMCKYGICNVRGGVYSQILLEKNIRKDLKQYLKTKRLSNRCKQLEKWHQADRCVQCGSTKHWANQCKAIKT